MGRPRKMPAQKPGMSEQSVSTPGNFLQAVHDWWGFEKFDYDLAAEQENAKAEHFFCKEEDALAQDWTKLKGNLWLNPEFGDIDPWAKKCALSATFIEGQVSRRRIFLLTPASVDSNWFVEWVWGRARVIALNGRLTFDGHDQPYPKGCILSIFGERPGFEVWRWPGASRANDSATPVLVRAQESNGTGGAVADEPPNSSHGPQVPVPPHVLADLGEHPMSTKQGVRKAFLVRAHHEGLVDASGDVGESWFKLVFKAPPGWFCRQPADLLPDEDWGGLASDLHIRGVHVTLPQVAGWSVIQRDLARAWCVQMGDKPVFFPSMCAACDKGSEEGYKHTGDGPKCRPTAEPAPEPKPAHPPPAAAGSGAASAAERTVSMFDDL